MEKQGYIKLHRKIVDWEWYTEVNTKCLFIHMLLKANHKDYKWRGEVIEKGTFITSVASLSAETGLTIRQIRTSINNLKKTGDIEVKATNRNTLIIIAKWELYQDCTSDSDKPNDNQMTNKRQTSDKPSNKNDKNDKNEKNIKTLAQSDCEQSSMLEEKVVISLTLNDKTEYPITEEKVNEFKELYPAVDIMQELRNMKGWLNSNPTKRKTKTGILRFVNSWLSKTQNKGGSQNTRKVKINDYPEL